MTDIMILNHTDSENPQIITYEEMVENCSADSRVGRLGRARWDGRDDHETVSVLFFPMHELPGHALGCGALDSWYSL